VPRIHTKRLKALPQCLLVEFVSVLPSKVSYQFADIVVDPDAFTVEKSGQVLSLEPKSIRLLLYLIQNRSRAVAKEELLRSVWEEVTVSDNSLARLVAQLRKGLGDDAKVARYIETVPTIGYRFIADVVEKPCGMPPGISGLGAVAVPTPALEEGRQPALQSTGSRSRVLSAAVVLLALLGVLVGFDLWERSRSNSSASWTGMALGGPVVASHPRLSPDGQLLAFRAIVDGLSQVAVMKPDSSSWTVLTHDRTHGAVASLAWSHDGSRIYFDREWGSGRIFTVGPLGGDPRLVMENAWLPEPLPDGSIIAQRHSSEGREQLLRFWPDTGRVQTLPASTRFNDSPAVRVFPGGREIAVFGRPEQAAGPRLFVLDLATLRVSSPPAAAPLAGSLRDPIAVSPDGASILIERRRNDTYETIAIPKSGAGEPQTLISLPSIAAPISADAGPDGSIYMDHSEFEQSVQVIDQSGVIKVDIPIFQSLRGPARNPVIAIPDGGIVFEAQRQGRLDLFLGRANAEPQLLLNGNQHAGLPGALLGDDKVAFLLGTPDQAHIAIASLRDGTVMRRFSADVPQVTAMTAPTDGRTIYYASNGTIWAQSASGGDPRKITQGYDVAVDPPGKTLYLIRTGGDGHEVFQMPAEGGEATRIALPASFNLTPQGLSSSAVGRDGRILLPVNLPDLFYFRTAVFDPLHRTMTPVPAPPRAVVMSAGWTTDGGIATSITHWSSSLWRYRRQTR
jgi:DNA-binding winged helix-turn-helix (wHTH) protein